MTSITFIEASGASHIMDVALGDSVMRAALNQDISGIIGECGGALACATCHCYVDDAWTALIGPPSSQDERDMLESTAAEIKPNSRLSCQIVLSAEMDGLIIHLPEKQY